MTQLDFWEMVTVALLLSNRVVYGIYAVATDQPLRVGGFGWLAIVVCLHKLWVLAMCVMVVPPSASFDLED